MLGLSGPKALFLKLVFAVKCRESCHRRISSAYEVLTLQQERSVIVIIVLVIVVIMVVGYYCTAGQSRGACIERSWCLCFCLSVCLSVPCT